MHARIYKNIIVLIVAAGLIAQSASAESGYYRVAKRHGVWWLVAPDGKPFISKGVDDVLYNSGVSSVTGRSAYRDNCQAKYGSEAAWENETAQRLAGWGFNTLGAWSDESLAAVSFPGNRHLAYAPVLNLGALFVPASPNPANAWMQALFPDVFDPKWPSFCASKAQELIGHRATDHNVLGWFLDNELHWSADWRSDRELLDAFLSLPGKAPGHAAAVDFLRKRYGGVSAFDTVWGTRFARWDDLAGPTDIPQPHAQRALNDARIFLGKIADLYFSAAVHAIRQAAPHHLVLGCRFANTPPSIVIAAAAKYTDVISINCYQTDPSGVLGAYADCRRPVIISEFSFRALDAGLPNSKGAGPIVTTQSDRATALAKYVSRAAQSPLVIGYHWFAHTDEPAAGRFDGENSNIGIVTVEDEPYGTLVSAMEEINRQFDVLHGYANARR